MLSLCYLPTAGRLTLTVIKGRNLKAMDITGKSGRKIIPYRFYINNVTLFQIQKSNILVVCFSLLFSRFPLFASTDPYVKVYLLCQGKRIKKKKTSVMKNTLHPIYNEAMVFDVPSENIEDVCLIVKVIDYDR